DRAQVAGVRIDSIRRSLNRDPLTDSKHLLRPARAAQDGRGAHLATIRTDLPVLAGDVEVNPRVWIDEIETREHTRQLDLPAAVERSPPALGAGARGGG